MATRIAILKPRISATDTRRIKPPPKTVDSFYNTPEWRQARDRAVAAAGHRCQSCGRSGVRLFVDHVVERRDGGPDLDPRNLTVKCGACHTRKTVAERAVRARTAPD